MPIDETRYMSVAWEMFLQKNYFVLSLNFEPYHHKPPFLFWMINLMWNIFGVSRWAGLIPIFVASLSVTLLTKKLAEILLPDRENITKLIPWLMMGSVPFLIYSTLVMFDMMLTVCVLLTLVLFLSYAWNGKLFLPLLAGLCMGAGVLVKGPVMYLYILWPLLLYPFWRAEGHAATAPKFYLSVFLAVCVSSIPVLLWLAPTLRQTDGDFAFWLL